MMSRLFFRFRTWLILLLFLALSISSPHDQVKENNTINQSPIVQTEIHPDATTVAENAGFLVELEFIFDKIIEESIALYDLLPAGDWSGETLVPAVMEFDIISQSSYLPPLYPPRVKRLLTQNSMLPENRWPDIPTLPPEITS